MTFNPVSFSGGYGAGQGAERAKGDREKAAIQNSLDMESDRLAQTGLAALGVVQALRETEAIALEVIDERNRLAKQVHELTAKNKFLDVEIQRRWIPYGLVMRASLTARKVEKEVLIDELKRLDPSNIEALTQEAERNRVKKYREIMDDDKNFNENFSLVNKESEDGRLT